MNDAREDDESADVVLPWSNLLLDGATRKLTLDRWDDLGLGAT